MERGSHAVRLSQAQPISKELGACHPEGDDFLV
jgi:hypothetical protein